MLLETPRDGLVRGVEAQRQIGGQHRRAMLPVGVVRIGNDGVGVLGHPLVRAGRALAQLPLETEQMVEVIVAPLRRRGGPGDFQAAGDGVGALAASVAVMPAQALAFQLAGFGFGTHVVGRAGTVGLAEGVAAGDQRHGLFIVHGHAREGVADVARRGDRVGVTVRAFRIDVDQAHLHGGQRVFQIAGMRHLAVVVLHQHPVRFVHARRAARIAFVATQPLGFAAPVQVLIRLPGVFAAAGKTEGLQAHRFQRDVAGENHQIGPGNGLAVSLLDRPQQAARLVQADVVRPAVERGEALLPTSAAATSVANAIRAGAMPGHAHEQRAVMAEVGRPPVLRIGHQRVQVLLERLQVQALERVGIVERRAQRVGFARMLAEQIHAQLLGPPIAIGGSGTDDGVVERALCFGGHGNTCVQEHLGSCVPKVPARAGGIEIAGSA
ncbi:type II secretion system protein C [Xanthomonas citri pv. aurantifolii str. ICPB 10535]|nr:type II secretion system protein C [Xanthomonas citri pv. aurantifolii str. ICPB 10535]